jgi:hypothetical protein
MRKTKTPEIDAAVRRRICAKLEWEGGLEYLIDGSKFPEVKDEHFHSLREAYIAAANELCEYLRYDEYADECGKYGDPDAKGQ